jgi:ferric iron reductase protein FhuF
MRELAAQTGQRLGVQEDRVAVSTFQLGYAARLWSPVLACALAGRIVPDLGRLQVGTGLPLRLWLPAAAGWHVPDDGMLADALYQVVVTDHLAPLAAGLRGQLAEGLLWGNAASAMIGSVTVLTLARPGLAQPARLVAGHLLATGLLRGTGSFTGPGLEFRRNSCCLYYRVPGGGLCGDCSFRQGER